MERRGERPGARTARGRWLLAVLGACAVLLAACGSDTPELPPAVTRPVTLRIAAFQGAETTALFRIIPEWEHITGNRVELGILDPVTGERAVAGDYASYREAVISNAEELRAEYDVIIVDDPWMPYLAANGKLAPLSPFGHETDPDIAGRSAGLGVWPPTFGPLPPDSQGTPRGDETYALPLVGNVMMLWYRADVISEPASMDELTSSLDAPDPAFIGSAGLAPSSNPHVFLTWLASRGGDIFDREWRASPLRSGLAAEALAEYLWEATRLGVPFEEFAPERYTSHARMLDGTASAAVAWAADAQQILTSSVSDQLRVTEFPAGRRSSALTGNWLLAIPTDAEQPEAAYDFLTWATSRDIMKTSALLGVPPARQSLFNDRELVRRYPWLPDVEAALSTSFARPRVPAWDVVEGIIGCALDGGLRQAATLDRNTEAAREELLALSRQALIGASRDIEGVMSEWGYYLDDSTWTQDPTARIAGDPRDEWDCEGGG
ncbi:MAG: extracellular solute-binding protein [Dehalococcoidia bacterium]|nr:extracellular solute-binding protein [Dehalococcoidia bacterium]